MKLLRGITKCEGCVKDKNNPSIQYLDDTADNGPLAADNTSHREFEDKSCVEQDIG